MCTGRCAKKWMIVWLVAVAWTFGTQVLVCGAAEGMDDPNAIPPLVVPDDVATIQEAIDAAVDGQVVVLRPMTYSGEGNCDVDFKGKPITVQSENPLDMAVVAGTVIDCNAGPDAQHRGFLFQHKEEASSAVAGLTIINGYHGRGGAILVSGSSPTVTNCVFHNNFATEGGGAICSQESSATIRACTFSHNAAGMPGEPNGCGGAIYDVGSSSRIASSLFMGNRAGRSGGAIQCDALWQWLPNKRPVICAKWVAVPLPGGGSCQVCTKWIELICPMRKICTPGPCVVYPDGTVKCAPETCIWVEDCGEHLVTQESFGYIANCTIVDNTSGQGGALDVAASYMTVRNSILWGNSTQDANSVGEVVISYSDVQGGFAGEGNIDVDPMFANPVTGDYRLLAGSPCIDAGDPEAVADPSDTDLDSNPRVGNGRVDMGAYEFYGLTPLPEG